MPVEFVDSSECRGRASLCFFPQWNKLASVEVVLGCHVGYLVLIAGLRLFMKTKASPCNPQLAMKMYNIVQIGLSLAMTVGLAPFLANKVFNINGKFNSTIEFWIFVHYVTKYLDMFDTVFMVLRKKDDQVSFLHLYHHATIGLLWGMLLHNGIANGTAFFGAWINSLIHSLMYSHYLWTSLGYHNPFKSLLTQLQMFQFFLCIVHAALVILLDTQITAPWAILQFVYHMTLLFLFMQFFRRDTKKRASVASRKRGEAKKE